ncbi:Bug family tripartite tricarboxylate transporter substrate binding protein [Sporosarcina highlanderae]|uniref:Tripartite tricarboxylate transporter substrate binding protein n=1 Tax=Sporosarcina highlanderae TaxID=3035916 RepID=A0ABT8JVI6_9BACL|nr:tripartite tricarboxylate transporter substrate binding protein [Sporosarcina highlanderae]MDN4609189.1 tripartite tricarboxylate transporter substrate binding protein [Sporosarcina highlanderae]
MKRFLLFMGMSIALILAACNESSGDADSADGNWKPTRNIEIVAPSGAGGGWDTTARMAAKVLEEEGLIDKGIGVVNKTGGGGAVGWAYIATKKGSPYNLFVTSTPMIDVPLNGQSEYDYTDFTPIANVIADYGAFAVKADSKWQTLNDLFDDMKKDPTSVTVIGSSSPGSMDHLKFAKFAKEAGVDITKIKYVSEQDGGELTALLNGSVDVFSTDVSEVVEQVRAGNIRVLAVTSEERLEGETISDFPTGVEQGINTTYINWRGFFGPKDLPEEALKYYEQKFKEMTETDAWKKIRANYGWGDFFMGHEEYKEFLKEQVESSKALLDELGIVR